MYQYLDSKLHTKSFFSIRLWQKKQIFFLRYQMKILQHVVLIM